MEEGHIIFLGIFQCLAMKDDKKKEKKNLRNYFHFEEFLVDRG